VDLIALSATEAVRLMRAGDLLVEQYAKAIVDRIAGLNSLNAFASFDAGLVLTQARYLDKARAGGEKPGPLFGLPIAVKDNICTGDYPTAAGTEALRAYRSPHNAPVLQTLLDQGALVAGKTNMHELALGITSNNGAFGAVRNPHNMDMIPGGSSGGSAVAVAAGMTPVALGTDTGTSVRLPAALCGIVGLRPTLGRYGAEGVFPVSSTRDTIGPMARTVEDVQFLDRAITGSEDRSHMRDLSGICIGVPREHFYNNLDPDVETTMNSALDMLDDLGAELIEVNIPDVAALNDDISFTLVEYEAVADLKHFLQRTGVSLEDVIENIKSPDVKSLYEAITKERPVPRKVYEHAIRVGRPKLQAVYRRYFKANALNAVVFPTAPMPARPIGQDDTVELNGKQVSTFMGFVRNTEPASVAGIPGLSIPAGYTASGLPVGIEFDGPENSDRDLMTIAQVFQKATGHS